ATAVALQRRLADRVLADRPGWDRLLRSLERERLRARPAPEASALGLPLRVEDHGERGACGRHALHRKLRGPAAGAIAGEWAPALDRARGRTHLRQRSAGRWPGLCPLLGWELADRLLDLRRSPVVVPYGGLRLLLARSLEWAGLLRFL